MVLPWHVGQLLVALGSICAIVATSHTASAQGFLSFLWGGGSREVVSFHPHHTPGQIIVSFGDKRLYFVHRRGEAVSYPIAIPREQSRWQGVAAVSIARQPRLAPTAEMRREIPAFPHMCPEAIASIHSACVRSTWVPACIAFMGADAPWTIGEAVSKGCIRLYNEDVMDLYPRVPIGLASP